MSDAWSLCHCPWQGQTDQHLAKPRTSCDSMAKTRGGGGETGGEAAYCG